MDAKITQLTENTSPADEDVMALVDDPAGIPITKKVTKSNLTKIISTDTINENAVGNGVVVDGLTIKDGRAQLPYAYDSDSIQRTITGDTYTTETNCQCTLSCKAGDIVLVTFNAMIRHSNSTDIVQGYIDCSDVNSLFGTGSQPFFSTTNGVRYGNSISITDMFQISSDGNVTFNTKWRVYYSGGTGYRQLASIVARVISQV